MKPFSGSLKTEVAGSWPPNGPRRGQGTRVLFFTHYFPPEVNAPATRTFEHCREWVKLGFDVTVVTCIPNHPFGTAYNGYRNSLFQREQVDGIDVVRVWTFLAANSGFTRRSLNYFSYLLGAIFALPRLRLPDVIVSTSPQFFCGLTGLAAKLVFRVSWILEVRDLWPESIVTVGAMRPGLITRCLAALEALAYNTADAIVPVSDAYVPHIERRLKSPRPIKVIKNGVPRELFANETAPEGAKRRLGLDGKFVISYVGTHGMAHRLETVLEAASRFKNTPSVAFLFAGDGANLAALRRKAESLKLQNTHFLGQRPKSEMPTIWAASDLSLIHLKRSETFKTVLPSKMFEAMAAECPIILGVEGEAKLLLETANAGIAIAPESADEMASAIRYLLAKPELRKAFGRSGKKYVRCHHDRARLALEYAGLFEAMVHE
ncbi:MAG: glycosyltransferase family 4 protein [Pseudomonadota bacterium]